MSYDAVLEQVKAAPEACMDEISKIISCVVYRYEEEAAEFNDVSKAALQEVEQMKKNPSFGKSYADVDKMMQDLLA